MLQTHETCLSYAGKTHIKIDFTLHFLQPDFILILIILLIFLQMVNLANSY